jgi:3-hydroxybutyryl-CoA dehydratase
VFEIESPGLVASTRPLEFRSLCYEELAIGMREVLCRTVREEDVIGFAEVSGDHNPLHLSEEFARRTRFGGRIVHGIYTASLLSAVLGMRLPGPGSIYLSQTLNFRRPVRIGDTLTLLVEVAELHEKGRRCRLTCTALVEGEVVMDGEAITKVPALAEVWSTRRRGESPHMRRDAPFGIGAGNYQPPNR